MLMRALGIIGLCTIVLVGGAITSGDTRDGSIVSQNNSLAVVRVDTHDLFWL